MPLDPLFWYGLVLKMAVTAAIVVAASVAVERSGRGDNSGLGTLSSPNAVEKGYQAHAA